MVRNCFVPNCDSYCKQKNITNRKMFLAPKALYEQWRQSLPNKREFKRTDRVCERHFDSSDIVEYWENNINGVIHRTKRDKAKLRDSAIPSLHIPSPDQLSPDIKSKILSNKIYPQKSNKRDKSDDDNSPKRKKILYIQQPDGFGSQVNIDEQFTLIEEDLESRVNAFENLYDEAFDVTFPNTLWGLHRDPDRKFLVFSTFNSNSMKFDKFLHIDDGLLCRVVKGSTEEKIRLEVKKCTTEGLSEWLDRIDKESC